MSTVRILDSSVDMQYINSVASHPLQSYQWEQARSAMGTETIRFGEFEGEELTQVFLMTIHPLPNTPFLLGYVPRSALPSSSVLTAITDFAQKRNCIFVKFEPGVVRSPESEEVIHALQEKYHLTKSSHQLFPDWTMIMDLTPSEEDLLAQMKSKTRYNIRLAERKGVTVSDMSTEEGYAIFEKLYFETTARQKYFGHNHEYHRIVWDHMKKGIAKIIIAFYEGKPLAAYELFLFHNVLYYPYGGSSNQDKNVMAPNLIMWEAIRMGKKAGATYFDMWGATHPDFLDSDPYAGFTRFKEGYNAQFTEMIGSYDLILNPVAYQVYSILYKVRNWYLTNRA